MDTILSFFHYDFLIRAFIAGILIGIIAPLVGIFLVVRRYSLMADTLAHVSLTGIAIGLLTNLNPIISAALTSVIAALLIEKLRSFRKIFSESLLAIFLSGSLALAIILIGLAHGIQVNITSFLFGSISTIQTSDLYTIAIFSTLAFGMIVLCYRELFSIAFDEELASISGLPVRFLNTLFIALTAITIALSIRIVGVLLIGALMVIPVSSALQFGKGFRQSIYLSILFSLISVIIGLFASYAFGLASGGTIVMTAIAIFIFSIFLNKK